MYVNRITKTTSLYCSAIVTPTIYRVTHGVRFIYNLANITPFSDMFLESGPAISQFGPALEVYSLVCSNTHSRSYREQHWVAHLLRAALSGIVRYMDCMRIDTQ